MSIDRYASYIEEGKQIVDTYCKSDDANEPMMCPPAPNLTKYVDKFREELGLSTDNRDDKDRQENYEAEVSVYRALEGLNEDICVLHSLEYTHGQYQLFVGDHVSSKTEGQKCKLKSQDKEGECDFLVIGRNYVVIIEVKNKENVGEVIPCEPEFHLCQLGEDLPEPRPERGCNRQTQINALKLKVLKDNFNKSQEQCAKTEKLIESIIDSVGGDKDTPILHFSAFPNFKKEFKDEFELDEEKKKGIICKEDLDCFDKWWKDNVTDHVSHPDSDSSHSNASCVDWLLHSDFVCCRTHMINSAASHVLLALWCCEQKKRGKYWFNKTKFCLRECIKDTDKKLRKAEFTQERKATARAQLKNPAVVDAPPIFKYLKVQYLSKKQHQAFSSNQKLLFINGPAGSGKTIIILGKIIELAKAEPDKKIIVIKPSPSPHYLETLQNAGVTSTEIILQQSALRKQPAGRCQGGYQGYLQCYSGPGSRLDQGPDFNIQHYVQNSISCHTEHQVVLIQLIDDDIVTERGVKKMCGIITAVADACHVFIDDSQVLFREYFYSCDVLVPLLTTLRARATAPTPSTVWWACDMVQVAVVSENTRISQYSDILQDVLASEQLITLSYNLRNTCDISKMVSAVRDSFIELDQGTRSVSLIPHADNGHFIHGPRPVIHVVCYNDEGRVSQIVEKELKKLCDSDSGERDIGLMVYQYVREATADSLRELDIVTRNPCIEVVSGCSTNKSYSVEWPAVLVVAKLDMKLGEDFSSHYSIFLYSRWLSNMYVLLSRGRVYCSAVLIAEKHNHELLDRLKPFARIKYYSCCGPRGGGGSNGQFYNIQ